VFPDALVQFEDFANVNAFRLLEHYRQKQCTFNDDIQGTGAVALAGLYSALRIRGGKLAEQKVVFLGAGEAAAGIAGLIVAAMVSEGLAEEDARRRCWLIDSRGLVVKGRAELAEHKIPYAHEHAPLPDLQSAVEALHPTVMIGVSGQPATFTQPVLAAMARLNDRPIVFALSNPTSKSECTAEQAYTWTEGRAIFASGSPYPPVNWGEKTFVPGQGNNSYIFPGIGLGAMVSGAKLVTDEMFFAAAQALAEQVSESDLEQGRIYPPLTEIREVSATISTAVAKVAYQRGLTTQPEPVDVLAAIEAQMYVPDYKSYV
jgi:malate dehydrogenase (oxaloacetate-decarboxylating)(NADP+)